MGKECGEKNEYIQLLIFQAMQENQDEARIEKDNRAASASNRTNP